MLRRAFIWCTAGKIQLDDVLAEVESHYIKRALEQTSGNKARAAALLGLNNSTTLSNRMSKHGLGTR